MQIFFEQIKLFVSIRIPKHFIKCDYCVPESTPLKSICYASEIGKETFSGINCLAREKNMFLKCANFVQSGKISKIE